MKNWIFILLASSLFGSDLQEPYASVPLMPEYPFGYYCNQQQIEELFKKHEIRVVIEVGSWLGGGSTRHMAEMLVKNKGVLYAVDTWLGSSTQQPGQMHFQPILKLAYPQFLSNMIHWNLTDVVIPLHMRSVEAAQILKVQPDLIYIDGEHTKEAVYEDLTAWYPFVKDHGILCGDDWCWDSVRAAVEQFAAENELTIVSSGNLWQLESLSR
jgi:hypothetical protein